MASAQVAERYLALDLGAESGRALVGAFDGQRLAIDEVHRFANRPVRLPTALHWDVLSLLAEVRAGIAAAEASGPLNSLSVDAWGVDFGLLDARGALLENPVHYRDARTDGMLEVAYRTVPREEIFEETGIQFLPINSLYQLLAMVRAQDPVLDVAATLLTIPDLLHYWLSGEKACEFTNATTTQCLNPRTRTWARGLLQRLGIADRLFADIVAPGTSIGACGSVRVVVPGSHDTASAVVGTPLRGPESAYISSGTWSLVGVEVREPVINARTLALNLTNEGGVADTFRLLRNVMGLWLVQGIRRGLASDISYDELTRLAADAPPLQTVIDPDAPAFLRADDMVSAIREFCRANGESVPERPGPLVRAALEGLALRSRWVIEHLEDVTGQPIHTIHLVGGGARNRLLCQMTADAAGRTVLAGPVEATALGNLIVQLMTSGAIASVAEGREVVARSFRLDEYVPANEPRWQAAYDRFLTLVGTADHADARR